MDDTLFDRRVVRRNINKGLVSQNEYDKHLSKLSNLAEECEDVEVTLYPADNEEERDAAEPEGEPKPE